MAKVLLAEKEGLLGTEIPFSIDGAPISVTVEPIQPPGTVRVVISTDVPDSEPENGGDDA